MTTELTEEEVDFEAAVGDPAAYYPDPQAIVADTTLSKAQKQRFLGEWAQDLSAHQVADGEGMVPDDSRIAALDSVTLKHVNAAIEQVEKQADPETPTTFRTVWARIRRVTG